jgi:hypothetical protein
VLKNALNGFLKNDTLVFRVEIHVHGGAQCVTSPYQLDDLRRDLVAMRSGPLADIELVATGTTSTVGSSNKCVFPANKCVLAARSPVFRAMLCSGCLESTKAQITLPESEAVLAELLHHMYAGAPSHFYQDLDLARDLLAAAAKYRVSDLQALCECRLSIALSMTNCIQTLIFADSVFALELRKNAMQFIARNLDQLVTQDDFTLLDESFLKQVEEYRKSMSRRGLLRFTATGTGDRRTLSKICIIC